MASTASRGATSGCPPAHLAVAVDSDLRRSTGRVVSRGNRSTISIRSSTGISRTVARARPGGVVTLNGLVAQTSGVRGMLAPLNDRGSRVVRWTSTALVTIVLVLAGVGIYSLGQPSAPEKVGLEVTHRIQPGEAGYWSPCGEPCPSRDELGNDAAAAHNNTYREVFDDAPSPMLRSGAAVWWFFGGAALAVLGTTLLMRRVTLPE